MNTPIVNDNGVNREMTADEAATYAEWSTAQQTLIAQAEANQQTKAARRKAALDKLGLTADEAAALFE